MLIDVHAHVAYSPLYSLEYLTGMIEDDGSKLSRAELVTFIKLLLRDKSGNRLLEQMNESNIQKAVLLVLDTEIKLKNVKLTIEEIHGIYFEIAENNSDRFLVFSGVDPRRGKAGLDLLNFNIKKRGVKGLKLYPPFGYSLDSILLKPYLEVCDDNNLTVLTHTGPSLKSLENHLADPEDIEKIARQYPNVNFILAHAAFQLSDELIEIISTHQNVFFDISGFQTFLNNQKIFLAKCFKKIFDNELTSRVLFGTDWPLYNLMTPLNVQIERLREFGKSQLGDEFESLLNDTMYKNALKALKL
jgi:uncharacterized protein